jgi:RND family efflux transporter MFP subunit
MTKRTISIISIFLIFSCNDKVRLEEKKSQLKELKSDFETIKYSIKKLESEISIDSPETIKNKIAVRLLEIEEKIFSHYIQQPGKLNSNENILVSSEMLARVNKSIFYEGEKVQKGQVVYELDSDIMQGTLEEIKLSRDFSKTSFERQKKLWSQKIGSELQYLKLKNHYETLEKKVAVLENKIAKLFIKAPITGTIEALYMKVGELASPGTPAFRITNTERIFIEADVPERYANILIKGSPVKINFKSLAVSKEAPISFVGQIINPENNTFKIKIELDNKEGRLKPNSIASLEILDYMNEKAHLVPTKVIKRDMRGDYVFLNRSGKCKKTYIEVGLSQGDTSHIIQGLELGDQVIVSGYNDVVNGSLLEIKNSNETKL